MGRKIDVTQQLERHDAFEERLGVRLEALSAFAEGPDDDGEWTIEVYGELHPTDGEILEGDIQLVLAAYDGSARLVQNTTTSFSADEFYGFEAFDLYLTAPVKVSKLRLYPKAY